MRTTTARSVIVARALLTAILSATLALAAWLVPAAAESGWSSGDLGRFGDPATGGRSGTETTTVSLGPGRQATLSKLGGPDGPTLIQPGPVPGHEAVGPASGVFVSTGPAGTVISGLGAGATTQTLDMAPAPARPPRGAKLDLSAVARDGRATHGVVMLFDVRTGRTQVTRNVSAVDPGVPCSTDVFAESNCAVVPAGTYAALAWVWTMPAEVPSEYQPVTMQSLSLVGSPELLITRDRAMTFDARRAVPIKVRTPKSTAPAYQGLREFGFTRIAANGQRFQSSMNPIEVVDDTFYVEPSAAVRSGQLTTVTRMVLEAPPIEVRLGGRKLGARYYESVSFADRASEFPVLDGSARLPVVDAGTATEADLAGVDLEGAAAVVRRDRSRSVGEQSVAAAKAGARLVIIGNDRPGDDPYPGGVGVKLLSPTVRVGQGDAKRLLAAAGKRSIDVAGEPASDYRYDLVIKTDRALGHPTDFRFSDEQLTVQDRVLYGMPTRSSTFSESAFHWQPGDEIVVSTPGPFRQGPRHRTDYRIPDPDTRWSFSSSLPEVYDGLQFPSDPELPMRLANPGVKQTFPTGSRTRVESGVGPIAATYVEPVQRWGDELLVAINGFGDQAGNKGETYTDESGVKSRLEITADGVVVGETTALPIGIGRVPAGPSTIAIDYRLDNPQPWAELSTSTRQTWTFPSDTETGDQPVALPVIMPSWDADLDLRNRMAGTELGLRLHHQNGATTPYAEVSVEVSHDDGGTWRPATVIEQGRGDYTVRLPPGRGYVSLRLAAADEAGSRIDQTIIRALGQR